MPAETRRYPSPTADTNSDRPEQPFKPTYRDLGGTMELPTPTGYTADSLAEARKKQILRGHVIWYIGAGPEGIVGAAALEGALQGATVVTSSRLRGYSENDQNEPARQQIARLRSIGSDALWLPGDVTDPEFANKTLAAIVEKYERIDSVVYGAASRSSDGPFVLMNEARLRTDHEVGYWGAYRAAKALADYLKAIGKSRDGDKTRLTQPTRFTVISSVASQGAEFQAAGYGATKAALNEWVKGFGREIPLVSQLERFTYMSGLRINAVSPGFVEGTKLIANVSEADRERARIAIGADRHLKPREVGQLATFVTSPLAEDMNGQIIVIIGRGQAPTFEDQAVI